MPIDYSKWKSIEVSDDEDDTHPNIDTPSLFRWRHQARLERMAEKKQLQEEIEKKKKTAVTKLTEIEQKMKDAQISEEDKKRLEKEAEDIRKQEEEYRRKEAELEEKERLEPWNVDTIGTEVMNKSRINKIGPKPEPKPLSEEEDSKRMAAYFDKHEGLLREFSILKGFEKSEEFLLEHPLLASDYAVNWLTIEALNHAIEMKESEMSRVTEQCVVLQYLLELAKSLKAEPTNTNMIKTFFKKLNMADPSYMKMYHAEVAAFEDRLRKRGKVKRDAALEELEAEEKKKRIEAAPGGLDPQEVYESLPKEMKDAFDSQEVSKLQEVATSMDQEVFAYHLQRCIDSGLWIPNANAGSDEEAEGHSTEAGTSNS